MVHAYQEASIALAAISTVLLSAAAGALKCSRFGNDPSTGARLPSAILAGLATAIIGCLAVATLEVPSLDALLLRAACATNWIVMEPV